MKQITFLTVFLFCSVFSQAQNFTLEVKLKNLKPFEWQPCGYKTSFVFEIIGNEPYSEWGVACCAGHDKMPSTNSERTSQPKSNLVGCLSPSTPWTAAVWVKKINGKIIFSNPLRFTTPAAPAK